MIRPLSPLKRQGNDPISPYPTDPVGRRQLRVLVDRESVKNEENLGVLERLAESPEVDLWWTTNYGEQWIDLDQKSQFNDQLLVTAYAPGHKTLMTLPASTWQRIADHFASEENSKQEVVRQLGFSEIASARRIDLFVSDSELLLNNSAKAAERVNIRTVEESVAHLALFLRSRGHFDLGEAEAFVGSRFWFYVVASRAAENDRQPQCVD